jgi:hypothetical protein
MSASVAHLPLGMMYRLGPSVGLMFAQRSEAFLVGEDACVALPEMSLLKGVVSDKAVPELTA